MPPPRLSRRGFLVGAAAGLAAGVPAAWLASRYLAPPFTGRTAEVPRPPYAMPGPYPGRVVEVRCPEAVGDDYSINHPAVGRMLDRGMCELTGADPGDLPAVWKRFFSKDDVVGIKVNPVGRAPKPNEDGRVPGAVGAVSSLELVYEVVDRLIHQAGLPPENVVVFDRYAREFEDAGYIDLVERELPTGVRWAASAVEYDNKQVDVTGFDQGRDRCSPEMARHVVGYDPDAFTVMGFCGPQHEGDERRYRSHLSAIVTRMIGKLITLPVLKDHRSAGVTLALKNLSHGHNNNVSRSHIPDASYGLRGSGSVMGPNQCNTFIPQAAGQEAMRRKATLHILDGLVGVYEGGPGCWNKTWGTWRRNSLFFATDPVALDHVGWDIIDAKRAEVGWAPVGLMGRDALTPATAPATASAPLAGGDPVAAAALAAAAAHLHAGRATEVFNRRTPDHVVLAGDLGLGVFDRGRIEHRTAVVGSSA
jgi:hypothetical protein